MVCATVMPQGRSGLDLRGCARAYLALLRRRFLPPQFPRSVRGLAEAGLWPERLKPPGDPGGWGVRAFALYQATASGGQAT